MDKAILPASVQSLMTCKAYKMLQEHLSIYRRLTGKTGSSPPLNLAGKQKNNAPRHFFSKF